MLPRLPLIKNRSARSATPFTNPGATTERASAYVKGWLQGSHGSPNVLECS